MNAIDLLTSQHREMEKKLGALKEAKPPSREDFIRMADELAAHITVEEELFYPAVKRERTEDILLESLEEHLSLKRVLADLLDLKTDEAKFEPKLHVLAEQAEHHHKEEEEHLFPKVRKLFDASRLEALGAEMEERMKLLRRNDVSQEIPDQIEDSAPLP